MANLNTGDDTDSLRPLRLLSLDGGGVRGLSSLMILKHLMEEINPENPPKPCQVFDMIGGTSTGGLIAIMLGRLRLDVSECIQAYLRLSSEVFKARKHSSVNIVGKAYDKAFTVRGKFDSKKLKQSIIEVIETAGLQGHEEMRESPDPRCKVFVCAVRNEIRQSVRLRSYKAPRGTELDCCIWEAARATSAATSFFDPVTIGEFGETFIDGAVGCNNPVQEVLAEARDVWPDANRRIQCFISIGTGKPSMAPFGKNLYEVAKSLVSIATETERTAEAFQRAYKRELEHRYFRFNVVSGLEEVGLDEHAKKNILAATTRHYLESEEVKDQTIACVEALKSIKQMHHSPRKETVFTIENDFRENYDSIRGWINPPSFDSDLQDRLEKRHSKTCEWVLAGGTSNEFTDWIQGKIQYLWVSGKPGCGKSTIAASIIDYLLTTDQELGPKVFTGYIFVDKRNPEKQSTSSMISTLAWQIICRRDLNFAQKEHILKAWRAKAEKIASVNVLLNLIRQLLPYYTHVKLVIDGLDESNDIPQAVKKFVELGSIPATANSQFSVLVLSQYDMRILKSLPPSATQFQISSANVEPDISKYVKDILEQELTDLQPENRKEIQSRIIAKSDGMFLWASLAVSQIVKYLDLYSTYQDLLLLVEQLPSGLSELYNYLLERIFHDDLTELQIIQKSRRDAKEALLKWVTWSLRPLRPEELEEAMRIDPSKGAIGEPSQKPVAVMIRQIMAMASPLITMRNDKELVIIHSSFRDFLVQRFNTIGRHDKYPPLGNQQQAHGNLSISCINYIEHVSEKAIFDSRTVPVSQFPFLEYATLYCWKHLRLSLDFAHCNKNNQNDLEGSISTFQILIKSRTGSFWATHFAALRNYDLGFLLALQSDVRNTRELEASPEWMTDLYRDRVMLNEQRYGEEHQHTLSSKLLVCMLLEGMGQYVEAGELKVEILEIKESIFGNEHSETLSAMCSLAENYMLQGRFKDAKGLLTDTLKLKAKQPSTELPDTLTIMRQLGRTDFELGRWLEAEELLVKTLEAKRKILGSEHAEIMDLELDLASIYRRVERYQDAEALQLHVLQYCKAHLGMEHLHTLGAAAQLVNTLFRQERFTEAEHLAIEILPTVNLHFGTEHPLTLNISSALAKIYKDQYRLKEARELQEYVTSTSIKLLGSEDPLTLGRMMNLSFIQRHQGLLKQSEDLHVYVLQARERVLGFEHPDTIHCIFQLALFYKECNRHEEAVTLLHRIAKLEGFIVKANASVAGDVTKCMKLFRELCTVTSWGSLNSLDLSN